MNKTNGDPNKKGGLLFKFILKYSEVTISPKKSKGQIPNFWDTPMLFPPVCSPVHQSHVKGHKGAISPPQGYEEWMMLRPIFHCDLMMMMMMIMMITIIINIILDPCWSAANIFDFTGLNFLGGFCVCSFCWGFLLKEIASKAHAPLNNLAVMRSPCKRWTRWFCYL